ncbi:unnamed protein product [Gongylonema pulchrum]|uniref:Phosphotransferase n=1 Tax=Gongylonema pulchrum TaxID=637853 RepID=A0A183D8G5_9BILA|nr:unnamed protein product [Gongylonema pulchrum]
MFTCGLGEKSCLKMLPSFVRDLPDGTEKGKFLVLDLGGANFRVVLVELNMKCAKIDSKIYPMPARVMTGTATQVTYTRSLCIKNTAQNLSNNAGESTQGGKKRSVVSKTQTGTHQAC